MTGINKKRQLTERLIETLEVIGCGLCLSKVGVGKATTVPRTDSSNSLPNIDE
jgi:hypothetical protein